MEPIIKVVYAEVVCFKLHVFEVALTMSDGSKRICTPQWHLHGAAQAYANAVIRGERKPEVREAA
jgi:hypothetical protein